MPIRLVPTSPNRNMTPEQYVSTWNTWLATFPGICDDMNALEGNFASIAAGGAFALPYIIDTSSTANADPGNGRIRFSNAGQSVAASLFVDVLTSGGADVSGLLDSMDSSTSTVKGRIRLVKVNDPTKYLTFLVNARTSGTGYRTLSVTGSWGSSPAPFANNDAVYMFFDRTGDAGSIGPAGTLTRRVGTVTTSNSPGVNVSTTDMLVITAQATTCAAANPTGTPTEGQTLMYRIKDNGTARAVTWGSAFRAGSEAPLPGTTVVGKWLYVGFAYNATDSRWDLISALNV